MIVWSRSLCIATVVIGILCGCAARYTTLDLAVLPCEGLEKFFYPIEFTSDGELRYAEQIDALNGRLKAGDIRNVFVIVHGWNKTSSLAERDYQDFICRFYLQGARERLAAANQTVIVGLFWPSTVMPDGDPVPLQPLTFFWIKNRADHLAVTGFQRFLDTLVAAIDVPKRFSLGPPVGPLRHLPASQYQFLTISDPGGREPSQMRLHLIGHSFGARMIVTGLSDMLVHRPTRIFDLAYHLEMMTVTLLNAPVPQWQLPTSFPPIVGPRRLLHLTDSMTKHHFADDATGKLEGRAMPGSVATALSRSVPALDILSKFALVATFNVYSRQDWANRFLYRIASGPLSDCALGACPAAAHNIVRAGPAGTITSAIDLDNDGFIWNIDATQVIGGHSDIYKGRVARMLWDLFKGIEPAVLLRRGHSYLARLDRPKALQTFDELIAERPALAAAYYGRGRTLALMNRHAEALLAYTNAIEHNPDQQEYFFRRAEAHKELGDEDNWLNDMAASIKAAGATRATAYTERAKFYGSRDEHSLAAEDWSEALRLASRRYRPFLLFVRGRAFAGGERYREAVEDFTATLEQWFLPEDFKYDVRLARAEAYVKLNEFAAARSDFDAATEIFPKKGVPYYARSSLYATQEQYGLELEELSRGIANTKDDHQETANLLLYRAAYFKRGGEHERAISDLEQSLAQTRDTEDPSIESYYELADSHTALGRHEGAIDVWTRAIQRLAERDPAIVPYLYLRRGRSLVLASSYELAESDLTRAADAGLAAGYRYRALARARLGRLEEARADYERARGPYEDDEQGAALDRELDELLFKRPE